jgi:hypothetical protein
MPILDTETWAEIRKAYVETTEPISQIAARFGIYRSTIQARASKEGWERPAPGSRIVRPPVAQQPAPNLHALARRRKRRKPDTAEDRIGRMLGIIDLQLDQMESRMTSGQPMTTQDEERQARAFGAIAGNLEKVTEAASDIFREAGHDGAANGHGDGRGLEAQRAEAERLRREIAERLERLNAQWLARGGAG